MNTNTWVIVGIVAIVVLAGGIYASMSSSATEPTMTGKNVDDSATMENDKATPEKSDDTMMKDDSGVTDKGDAMMKAGSYESYSPDKLALAEKGKVVLFFRASWCPTCRTLDASIRSNLGAIPEGVAILDVDYDNSTALKQKYGVTYQHTLVQVDASGGQIAKWSGSPTLADLVSRIQ